MKKIYACTGLLTALSFFVFACTKDKGVVDTSFTDAKFFALVQDTTGAKYYKDGSGSTQFQTTSNSSPFHGNNYYELRMNARAFNACTASGKLPAGGTFPDSSLLIKQLRPSPAGAVSEYAAIYKLNGSWNWAMFSPSGNVDFSIHDDATANCISCHNSNARDFVRTFDEHP